MKFILMCCLLVLVGVGAEEPVFRCGRQLAKARVLLCFGSEYVNKRMSSQDLIPSLVADDEKWGQDGWPWSGRRGALSANWSRNKRAEGIVDECCFKPCTTNEILKYC